MAVFYYCARVQRDGRTDVLNGIVEAGEPSTIGGYWYGDILQFLAQTFVPPADPVQVQITSLTRIGG